jgi:hypothetical protein
MMTEVKILKCGAPRFDTVMNDLDWAFDDYPLRGTVECL